MPGRLESEVGKGALFRVFFPAAPGAKAGSAKEEPPSMPRGQGEMVMVVDDDAGIREATQWTLEHFGYQVVTAMDGTEALVLFAQQQKKGSFRGLKPTATLKTSLRDVERPSPFTNNFGMHLVLPRVRADRQVCLTSFRKLLLANAAGDAAPSLTEAP